MIRGPECVKDDDVCYHFGKKLKISSGKCKNPIEIPMIRRNQFRVLRSIKLGKKMVSSGNFARTVSLCVGFHFGTLYGYFFQQDFCQRIHPLEHKIKLVLNSDIHTVDLHENKTLSCTNFISL